MKQTDNNQFHITLGTTIEKDKYHKDIESRIDVTHDLRLLKAALLYADQVDFYSFGSASMLNLLDRPSKMSEEESLQWLKGFYKDLGNQSNINYIDQFVQAYMESKRKQRSDFQNYLRYKRALAKTFRDMDSMAETAGIKDLNIALHSGFVEFTPYLNDDDNAISYFSAVSNAITSSETYPIFDNATGELVDLAIKEKIIPLSEVSERRAKHVGVSSDLIARLPLFDFASVDEILDIRKEFEKPLIRFRGAILNYSREISNAPWTKEFPQEVEELYLKEIQPTILDIEDAYKSSKSLINIIPQTLKHKGFAGTSILGLALSPLSQFPETFFMLSVVAGATLGIYEAVKEHRESLSKKESHQLFFYYQVGRSLTK